VAQAVPASEVAVGTSCLQIFTLLGGVCGAALSTLIYSNVGKLDVNSQAGELDENSRKGLLRGLRASFWFWAGMCFFGKWSVRYRPMASGKTGKLTLIGHCAFVA
jgi:hypothetical protein